MLIILKTMLQNSKTYHYNVNIEGLEARLSIHCTPDKILGEKFLSYQQIHIGLWHLLYNCKLCTSLISNIFAMSFQELFEVFSNKHVELNCEQAIETTICAKDGWKITALKFIVCHHMSNIEMSNYQPYTIVVILTLYMYSETCPNSD